LGLRFIFGSSQFTVSVMRVDARYLQNYKAMGKHSPSRSIRAGCVLATRKSCQFRHLKTAASQFISVKKVIKRQKRKKPNKRSLFSTYTQRRKLYTPPHRSCALQTGPAFSLGRSPSPGSRTLACSHTAIRSAP